MIARNKEKKVLLLKAFKNIFSLSDNSTVHLICSWISCVAGYYAAFIENLL